MTHYTSMHHQALAYGAIMSLFEVFYGTAPARFCSKKHVLYLHWTGESCLILTRDNIANQMGSPSKAPGGSAGEAASWSELPRAEILTELTRILESHHFSASKKCSRFLRHIVEAALEGRFDSLKERTLGVDVFERAPHYDTNQDPIVRGTAGEVRKRLAQYYLETGAATVRFTLPPGSYIPEVHPIAASLERHVTAPLVLPATVSNSSRQRFVGIKAAAAALAICAAAAVVWFWQRQAPLDRFWAPLLQRDPVLVCIGQPQLYTFRPQTAHALNAWFDSGAADRRPPQPAPVPLGEIVPMWSTPIALADAQAFSRLANLFAQKHKRVDLRGERLVSLSDLRGKPAVFIGAFDNRWTLSFVRDLRFYFDSDAATNTQFIRDRQHPNAADWKLADAWPPGRAISEDYALVTRVVNRTTEQSMVVVAGIAPYGTEAAAEFLTHPSYFAQALVHAPRDWPRKNIQVVLKTRVLSGVGGPPCVIAVYFW